MPQNLSDPCLIRSRFPKSSESRCFFVTRRACPLKYLVLHLAPIYRERNRTGRTTYQEDQKMDAGASSAVSGDTSSRSPPEVFARWTFTVSQRYQQLLDKLTPHILYRWIGFFAIAIVYLIRLYFVQGFYIVTYALGIYVLSLIIGFLSPQEDPALQDFSDGPTLPVRSSDEFRPFVRRLPEFKFWYSTTRAFCIAFVLTFFGMFDVPVFWPILLFYFIILFTLTMKRQLVHMIKYKYVPFTLGKQRYGGRSEADAPRSAD